MQLDIAYNACIHYETLLLLSCIFLDKVHIQKNLYLNLNNLNEVVKYL